MITEFEKEKVFWTRKMNVKLIKYMESKSNMWNPKHPKYTSIGCRDETYAEFASKYGNEFSWEAVKDRWTNIRSTFGFYMRKIHASRAKGEEFKVNWYLWESCKFLMKVQKTANNAGISASNTHNISNDENSNRDQPELESSEEDNLSCTETGNDINVSCGNIADNIVTVFRGVQNNTFGAANTKHAQVGHAVTKKLSKLNSYNAAQLSQKIMEILAQYDENNPMNPNNT